MVNLLFLPCLIYWRLIMLTAEQIIASNKASLETLFGLTSKAFEGVEKMVDLNMTATKAALSESAEHAQAAMGVKDAQEFMALQAGLIQPLAEKTAAYGRHLYDIASSAGAEFAKNMEEQSAEAQKKILGLVESATKNAPAGSESAMAMMKSAVSTANAAYESVQKSVKQATEKATEMAEKNFTAVSDSAVKATSAATATAKKR